MDKILSNHLDTRNGKPKLTKQATAFNSREGTGPSQCVFTQTGNMLISFMSKSQ